jgi:hypothetical protein
MMMVTAGRVIWRNTPSAVTGATIPTTLHAGTNPTELFVEGVDLGNITTQLVNITTVANSRFTFKDCKLNASVLATASGAGGFGQPEVTVIRCDSGTGYYRNEKSNSSGKMTTSAAVYTTGGASDGGTPISWQVGTTANNKFETAFTSLPISIWNDTIGSAITVTIEAGIAAAATSTPNSDIWIEVEYLGTSGSTLASKATSGLLTAVHTGSNYSTGSATWNGGVVNSKFKMAATFTPQVAGPMTIYVKAGTASATYYVDPKPVIT